MEVIAMTGEQKLLIQEMRLQGTAYSQIADVLGLSVNTVKSFCRRSFLSNACDASKDTGNEDNKDTCKHCGKHLKQTPKAKPKIFCGTDCRYAWWNTHRNQPNRKASRVLICAHCGEEFIGYGSRDRKYCGHSCYITARFGEVDSL